MFDGVNWTDACGTGTPWSTGRVNALASFQGELYAGGYSTDSDYPPQIAVCRSGIWLAVNPSNLIWATTDGNGVLSLTAGQLGSGGSSAIYATGASTGAQIPIVIASTDGGATWTQVGNNLALSSNNEPTSLAYYPPTHTLYVGGGSALVSSYDITTGLTGSWTYLPIPWTPNPVLSLLVNDHIQGLSGGVLYAGGFSGTGEGLVSLLINGPSWQGVDSTIFTGQVNSITSGVNPGP